ncbi:hypothetical protein ABZT04_21450 [Streptomyces sp. NPDC005492]|uniref:hypothetical protein n=1 Tax=Streptomyces sp. NPDC005492 TaxID=3156883 RepID=UPI00339E1916
MAPTGIPEPVLVDALGCSRTRGCVGRSPSRMAGTAAGPRRSSSRKAPGRRGSQCCKLLDEPLVPDAGVCFPDRVALLPRAIRLLERDPDPRVRARAVELVGPWVHSRPDALAALTRARDAGPPPPVRKKAGWYTPGSPIHRRTTPPGPACATSR